MTPLQTELALPAYAGFTDQQAADALNAVLVAGRRLAPLWEVQQWIQVNGILAPLTAAALAPTDPRYNVAVQVYHMVFLGKFDNVDFDNSAVKPMLDGLVTAGLISSDQRTALDSLANVSTTRAAQLGFRKPVTANMVTVARIKDEG